MSSSPPLKRRKACEACRILKARCEPSDEDPDETCERCWRAGKDCVPAQSRRQRDRIAELESQVAELTRALQEQNLSPSESQTSEQSAKRKRQKNNHGRSAESTVSLTTDPTTDAALAFFDERVDEYMQQEAVDIYSRQIFPVFPVVPIPSDNLDSLRAQKPLLLLSVITFASARILSKDVQDELVERIMIVFAHNVIATGNRSLDLVQALLVAAFWFRVRPGLKHATMCQLVQLATSDAVDLGIAGPHAIPSPGAGPSKVFDHGSFEARRTWLTCFIAKASLSAVMRRNDAVIWTPYHDECLLYLTNFPDVSPTDSLFCQFFEAERLLHRVATTVGLCDPTMAFDLTSPVGKQTVSVLRQEISQWQVSTYGDAGDATIQFYLHIALAYLNEPVLHTATNKLTFGVPSIPQKLEPDNFAAPVVTVERFAALYALKDALQGALDIALELDVTTLLGVTSLSYIPRILYALFTLIKLYIAVSAPGNTYGAVLDKKELRLEEYFRRMKPIAKALRAADGTSFNSIIIGAYVPLEHWFMEYKAIVEDYVRNVANTGVPGDHHISVPVEQMEPLDFHKEMPFDEDLMLASMEDQVLMASMFSDQLPFPMMDVQT